MLQLHFCISGTHRFSFGALFCAAAARPPHWLRGFCVCVWSHGLDTLVASVHASANSALDHYCACECVYWQYVRQPPARRRARDPEILIPVSAPSSSIQHPTLSSPPERPSISLSRSLALTLATSGHYYLIRPWVLEMGASPECA